MIINPNEKIIANNSQTAVKYAKSFGKTLDYSEASIKDVEEILDFYSKDLNPGFFKRTIRKISGKQPTANQIYSMATIWGTYLGEVIRIYHSNNCDWCLDNVFGDGEVLHLQIGQTKVFPIDKAYKRLINGAEDSVISFYDLGKDFINDEIG
ncbi:MAG: hypothetical protein J7639_06425 [Paenibacillaceae bacterium]|nr:hypothetical protein [Paenibacillaceae bacterium]